MDHKEYKLYRVLSFIFFPAFIAAIEILVFAPFSKNIFGSLIIGLSFFTLYPTLSIYKKYLNGEIDLDVSDRLERPRIFASAITGFDACAGIFWFIGDRLMLAVSLSYFIVTTFIMLINFFSKISTHTAGLAGPITAAVFYFGIYYAPLYLLLLPVAYARFKLGMHNRFQLTAGAVVSTVLTYLIFSLVL